MKKLLSLFVALATLLVFTGCEQDAGKVEVSNSQYNVDLEGRTLTRSEQVTRITKNVGTSATVSELDTQTDIYLGTETTTITFSELNEDTDMGTVTMVVTYKANSNADTDYDNINPGTYVSYSPSTNNAGFANKVLKTTTTVGSYEVVEIADGREAFNVVWATETTATDDNGGSVPYGTNTFQTGTSWGTDTVIDSVNVNVANDVIYVTEVEGVNTDTEVYTLTMEYVGTTQYTLVPEAE